MCFIFVEQCHMEPWLRYCYALLNHHNQSDNILSLKPQYGNNISTFACYFDKGLLLYAVISTGCNSSTLSMQA
ncbi:hypothetical protein EDF84_104237 [Erwinia rhapontici]|nr:hypothetical protein EDF84_104237 [Erwinia rhapontici]